MNVRISNEGTKTLVVLNGRIDTTNVGQFHEDIQPLLEGDNPDIEIDCRDMEYTSSQGLRMFLVLQKSVNTRNGSLVLKNMQPQVKEVFDITGFSNIIKIL